MSAPSKFNVMRANRATSERQKRAAERAELARNAPPPTPIPSMHDERFRPAPERKGWLARAFDYTMGLG
jgi:hypothetical protein